MLEHPWNRRCLLPFHAEAQVVTIFLCYELLNIIMFPMDKIIEAFLPRILTERVLLIIAFLILFVENYLLLTHRGNIGWLNDKLNKLSVEDISYFLIFLALSWVFVLPFVRVICTFLYMFIFYKSAKFNPIENMTDAELLKKAVSDDNSVAYQYLEDHIKRTKSKQITNEFYFYLMLAVITNIFFTGSFMRAAFNSHYFLSSIVTLVVIYLGIAVGIVDAGINSGGITDIPKKNK